MEVLSFLQKTVPFDSLPKVALLQICSRLKTQKFLKDSFVFKKGEKSHQVLYIVYEGLAEVIVASENQNVGYSFRKPHDIFGETVFLTGNTYPASVKVVRDMSCFLLDVETFEDLCVKYPSFAKFFNQILSERMRSLYEDLILSQSYEVTGLESNPFRHRLSEVMISPVATCQVNDSVQKIAQFMNESQISSVAVLNDQEELAGIITEKDLVTKCLLSFKPPNTWPQVQEVMNHEPVKLPPDALYYQGLLTMVKNKCKHILITEGNKLKGIVTIGDLIKFRSMGAFSIIEDIEGQTDLIGLSRIRPQVDSVLKALAMEKANPQEICEIVTEFNDRIIGKTVKLCEQEMAQEGLEPPPADYCLVVMGSTGRKEQLAKAEQYNGIVFDDVPEESLAETTRYFARLGQKIVAGLEQIGFAKCPEGIMADNPDWCKPAGQWYETVKTWTKATSPEQLPYIKKFFDLRPVYGRVALANNLKEFALEIGSQADEMLKALAEDELVHDVPLNYFKKTVTEKIKHHKEEINIKQEGCLHVINCIRIFAINEKVVNTCTLKRVEELTAKGVIPKEDAEFLVAAYQSLVMFRLKTNLEKLQAGKVADDLIDPNSLTKKEYSALKEAFLAASQLQRHVKAIFT